MATAPPAAAGHSRAVAGHCATPPHRLAGRPPAPSSPPPRSSGRPRSHDVVRPAAPRLPLRRATPPQPRRRGVRPPPPGALLLFGRPPPSAPSLAMSFIARPTTSTAPPGAPPARAAPSTVATPGRPQLRPRPSPPLRHLLPNRPRVQGRAELRHRAVPRPGHRKPRLSIVADAVLRRHRVTRLLPGAVPCSPSRRPRASSVPPVSHQRPSSCLSLSCRRSCLIPVAASAKIEHWTFELSCVGDSIYCLFNLCSIWCRCGMIFGSSCKI